MKKSHSRIDSLLTAFEELGIFRLLSSSFRSWSRGWPFILLSVLVDFLFVVSASVVITLIQFTLFEHLEALMAMTGEATGGLMNIYNQTSEVSSGLMGLSNNPDFQYHISVIFKYVGVMILSVFVLWVIFQGISWYLAHRMSADKRQPFLVFWKNFAITSVPFFFLTVIWIFVSVRILFAIKMSIAPVMGESMLNFLFAVAVIVTWYFGSLCYTLTSGYAYQNLKQCFVFGVRRFTKVIQSFAALAVIFFILDRVLRIGFIRNDPFVLMVIGTILFMPALVFARMLLFKTTQEYWPEQHKK
jgi:hypothetical protein